MIFVLPLAKRLLLDCQKKKGEQRHKKNRTQNPKKRYQKTKIMISKKNKNTTLPNTSSWEAWCVAKISMSCFFNRSKIFQNAPCINYFYTTSPTHPIHLSPSFFFSFFLITYPLLFFSFFPFQSLNSN